MGKPTDTSTSKPPLPSPDLAAPGRGAGGSSSAGPSTSTHLIDLTSSTPPDHDPDEPLPSYEDSTSAAPVSSSPVTSPPSYAYDPTAPPAFSIYQPVTHEHYLNNHLISHDPHLNRDGEALHQFLLEQAHYPPVQHVAIQGTHEVRTTVCERDRDGKTTTRVDSRTVTDFRFRVDLTPGLWAVARMREERDRGVGVGSGTAPSKVPMPGVLKVLGDEVKCYRGGACKSRWAPPKPKKTKKKKQQCRKWWWGRSPSRRPDPESAEEASSLLSPPPPEPAPQPDSTLPLRSWCDRYCHAPTTLKEFIVRKTITNLSHPLLTTLLTRHLRATGYRGTISITFPQKYHKVAIYPSTRLARLRQNPWVRWFFYLTFLWVVAWPVLYLATRKYHVVVCEWVWGFVVAPGGEEAVGRGAVLVPGESERVWAGMWRGAVMRAAGERRRDDGCLEAGGGVAELLGVLRGERTGEVGGSGGWGERVGMGFGGWFGGWGGGGGGSGGWGGDHHDGSRHGHGGTTGSGWNWSSHSHSGSHGSSTGWTSTGGGVSAWGEDEDESS